MRAILIASVLVASLLLPAPNKTIAGSAQGIAGPTMYGGNGGHNNGDSINDGSLVIVDQMTAAVTLVGHPAGVDRLTGIAFDSTGALFGSTISPGGFPPPPPVLVSTLIRINPDTGALISTIGPITDGAGGPQISISDLAVQPGTDLLFGVRSPNDGLGGEGKLYTIDTTTGVATLVGDTQAFFASIAFAPDGTLYESAADLGAMGNRVNIRLNTLDPSDGTVLTSVATQDFFGALGIRPTDGVIFGGTGDAGDIYTIDPVTGTQTLVGNTGQNFVGDLDFRPVNSPTGGFDVCLQDDSNGNIFQFNSTTGDYQGSNCAGLTITGTGTVQIKGGTTTLTDIRSDRRLLVQVDRAVQRGKASLQVFPTGQIFTIIDRDLTNDTCSCSPTASGR
jgi:hypothetical protein